MSNHHPSDTSLVALASMFILLAIAAFTYLILLGQGNTAQGSLNILHQYKLDLTDPSTFLNR